MDKAYTHMCPNASACACTHNTNAHMHTCVHVCTQLTLTRMVNWTSGASIVQLCTLAWPCWVKLTKWPGNFMDSIATTAPPSVRMRNSYPRSPLPVSWSFCKNCWNQNGEEQLEALINGAGVVQTRMYSLATNQYLTNSIIILVCYTAGHSLYARV